MDGVKVGRADGFFFGGFDFWLEETEDFCIVLIIIIRTIKLMKNIDFLESSL